MSDAPSQSQDKFIVRLPDGMRDRIKAAADANNRSMNSEIVATLEQKYPAPISLKEEFMRLGNAIIDRLPPEQAKRALGELQSILRIADEQLRSMEATGGQPKQEELDRLIRAMQGASIPSKEAS